MKSVLLYFDTVVSYSFLMPKKRTAIAIFTPVLNPPNGDESSISNHTTSEKKKEEHEREHAYAYLPAYKPKGGGVFILQVSL